MALIDCPECGHRVSSEAPGCPECAFPLAPPSGGPPTRAAPRERIVWRTAFSVAVRVVLGGFLFTAGVDGVADAAIIGGAIIGLSAIPTIYRGRIEWLRTRGATAIPGALEQRMEEMEHLYQDQIDRLEQRHTDQVADLEERLDFAERLLTKNKT